MYYLQNLLTFVMLVTQFFLINIKVFSLVSLLERIV